MTQNKIFKVGEYGVENTMELIKFGATLTHTIHDLKNGFQLDEEIPNFIATTSAALPAFADFDLIDDELLDMDADEEQILTNYTATLMDELGFVNTDTKGAIVDFVNAAFYITRAMKRLPQKTEG